MHLVYLTNVLSLDEQTYAGRALKSTHLLFFFVVFAHFRSALLLSNVGRCQPTPDNCSVNEKQNTSEDFWYQDSFMDASVEQLAHSGPDKDIECTQVIACIQWFFKRSDSFSLSRWYRQNSHQTKNKSLPLCRCTHFQQKKQNTNIHQDFVGFRTLFFFYHTLTLVSTISEKGTVPLASSHAVTPTLQISDL